MSTLNDDLAAVHAARDEAERLGDLEAVAVLEGAYEGGSHGRQHEVLAWWAERQAKAGHPARPLAVPAAVAAVVAAGGGAVFKPYGFTERPRTCRWCGGRLFGSAGGGFRGNGRFCSLHCGYQWAVTRAGGTL